MNVSWRPVRWRLVAGLVVVWSLCAAAASAQTVRVKIGPANVYERPRASSDVVTSVPEGTVLEVLQREGPWYWVLLPRDAHGTQRSGYVPAYVVERVGDKGLFEPGVVGMPSVESRPEQRAAWSATRFVAAIGWGEQFGGSDFSDHVTFVNQLAGWFDAKYSVPNASGFDASFGVRIGPQFVINFAYWRSSGMASASVEAWASNSTRTAQAGGLVVDREENDGHLQLTFLLPIGRRVDLAIFGGPSLFYLKQDLIQQLDFGASEFSSGELTINRTPRKTVRQSKAVIGVNVGADLTVMVWRFLGVGVGGRYARGSMDLASAGSGAVSVDVGGLQMSGGLRFRF